MRKKQFGKLISLGLAAALAFTSVVPGGSALTVNAATSEKTITFEYDSSYTGESISDATFNYTSAEDPIPGSVTAFSFANNGTAVTQATAGGSCTCSNLNANATYMYVEDTGWTVNEEAVTVTITASLESDLITPQPGDTVTVSGYTPAVEEAVSPTSLTVLLPDADTAAGEGFTGTWSAVCVPDVGAINATKASLSFTEAQLKTIGAADGDGGAVTISLAKEAIPATSYTVTYYANDGTEATATETVEAGEHPTGPATPFTRIGYTQDGWLDAAEGDAVELSSVTTATDLYADWDPNTLTINYAAGAGSGDAMEPTVAYYDNTEIALSPCTFTAPADNDEFTDYQFAGWKIGDETYLVDDNNTTALKALIEESDAAVTATALWEGTAVEPEEESLIVGQVAPTASTSAGNADLAEPWIELGNTPGGNMTENNDYHIGVWYAALTGLDSSETYYLVREYLDGSGNTLAVDWGRYNGVTEKFVFSSWGMNLQDTSYHQRELKDTVAGITADVAEVKFTLTTTDPIYLVDSEDILTTKIELGWPAMDANTDIDGAYSSIDFSEDEGIIRTAYALRSGSSIPYGSVSGTLTVGQVEPTAITSVGNDALADAWEALGQEAGGNMTDDSNDYHIGVWYAALTGLDRGTTYYLVKEYLKADGGVLAVEWNSYPGETEKFVFSSWGMNLQDTSYHQRELKDTITEITADVAAVKFTLTTAAPTGVPGDGLTTAIALGWPPLPKDTALAAYDVYPSATIAADSIISTATVTRAGTPVAYAEPITVEIKDDEKAISSLTYVELADNKGEWIPKVEEKTATITDGAGSITISQGNKLWITDCEPADAYHVFEKISEQIGSATTATPLVAEEDEDHVVTYTTSAFTAAGKIIIDSKALEQKAATETTPATGIVVAKVTKTGSTDDITPTLSGDADSLVTVGTKKYVKRVGGYSFQLTPAANTAVTKVEYQIKGSEVKETATSTISGQTVTYTIPEDDVQMAILAGGATIIATVEAATYTVKVSSLENIATATYTEYIVTNAGEKNRYTPVDGKVDQVITLTTEAPVASISVDGGHVIGIKVTPKAAVESGDNKANGYLITGNSVKVDGTAIAAATTDEDDEEAYDETIAGQYMVGAATTTDAGITVKAFAPVNITVTEASKTEGTGESAVTTTWTATSVYDGQATDVTDATKKIVTGDDIIFYSELTSAAGRDGVDDYYATFGDPTAAYGDSSATTPLTVAYDDDYEVYVIDSAYVEAAIEAGKDIAITAHAEPVEINTVKFTLSDSITGVYYTEYASRSAAHDSSATPILSHGITSSSTSGPDKWTAKTATASAFATGEVQKGNYVVLHVTTTNDGINFVKVFEGEDEIGDVSSSGFELGYISASAEFAVNTATLKAENVKFAGDTAATETRKDYYVGSVSTIFDGEVEYLSAYYTTVNLSITDNDPVQKYRIKSPVTYKVATGSGTSEKVIAEGKVEAYTSGGSTYYYLTKDAVSTAAFAGATITITATLQENGKKSQVVYVEKGGNAATTKISVNGKVVNYDDGEYETEAEIPYGQNAQFKVTGNPGSVLDEVRYAKAAAVEAQKKVINTGYPTADWTEANQKALETWLATGDNSVKVEAKDNVAEFTIPKVEEAYVLYYMTSDVYALVVDGVEVTDTATAISHIYNDVPATIAVMYGTSPMDFGTEGTWTVTATVPKDSSTEDVSAVFGTLGSSETYLDFNTKPVEKTYGKTVTVTLASKEKKGGEGTDKNDPKYSYTLQFAVSSPLTAGVVEFASTADVSLALGTKATIALTTGTGFTAGCYEVGVAPAGGASDYLDIESSTDGATLYVYADPEYANYLVGEGKYFTLSLVDAVDHETQIGTATVKVTVNTTQVTGADLSGIKAEADTDSITFNFSGVNGTTSTGKFDPTTEGLYYLLGATKTSSGEPEFVSVSDVLVPATATTYTLVVTNNDDALAADPVTYTATAKLVQVWFDSAGVEHRVAISAGGFSNANVKTTVDGIFATKITFKKDSAAPKKIFSTMDYDIKLGEVNFPDAAKNTPVTAQRISKVEVQTTAGVVVASTANGDDGVDVYGKAIVVNPNAIYEEAGLGKYNVVAYALEPKGKEVTCKTQINILQGITGLTLVAPDKIYKAPGKAAKITAKVGYKPTTKPLPAVKKVTWSLYDDDGDLLTTPGITIKNGNVSIAKTVVIPDEGLNFTIVATAADYAGHENVYATEDVEVYSTPMDMQNAVITIGGTELVEGGSYYTDEITGSLNAYIDGYAIDGVKFAVSGIAVDGKDASGSVKYAYANKITKSATVTATLTDGSNLKKKVKFSIKSDEDLTFDLYKYDGTGPGTSILDGDAKNGFTAVNDNAANKVLLLHVSGKNGAQISHSVAFKGLKKVKAYNYEDGAWYYLLPTQAAATITITDKTIKDNKPVIKVTNTQITAAKTATKITASNVYETGYDAKKGIVKTKDAKGKIFNYLAYPNADAYEAAGSFNKVTYTVTEGGSAAANKKAIISTTDDGLWGVIAGQGFDATGIPGMYEVTLDAKGQFSVDYQINGKLSIAKGNHSFTVTPIDKNGVAEAKTVTVKVAAAPAPKAKVAISATSFKNFGSDAAISFKTMNNVVFTDIAASGDTPAKANATTTAAFTGTRGINTKGIINKFATVFSVTKVVGKLTCIKDPKNYDKDYTLKPSAGMQGWIEYSWTNLDGTTGHGSTKVKVTPVKNGEIKPAATTP